MGPSPGGVTLPTILPTRDSGGEAVWFFSPGPKDSWPPGKLVPGKTCKPPTRTSPGGKEIYGAQNRARRFGPNNGDHISPALLFRDRHKVHPRSTPGVDRTSLTKNPALTNMGPNHLARSAADEHDPAGRR